MNKVALKHIDKISKQLPAVKYRAAIERQFISGEDILLSGVKEVEGKPVEKEKQYLINVPVIREIDHKQRMKKIYKKRGKVGLITYVKPYIKDDKIGPVSVFIMRNIP